MSVCCKQGCIITCILLTNVVIFLGYSFANNIPSPFETSNPDERPTFFFFFSFPDQLALPTKVDPGFSGTKRNLELPTKMPKPTIF